MSSCIKACSKITFIFSLNLAYWFSCQQHPQPRHPTWLEMNRSDTWAFSLHTSIGPCHDEVIKWKHFPRYWPFVWGIHRSPVNSPHKGQWRGALMFSLICVWINGWENNREAGDLRHYRAHYDVTVMYSGNICHELDSAINSPKLYGDAFL